MRLTASALLGLAYLGAVLSPFRELFPRFTTHVIGDHGDALLQHLHCSWQWLALAEGRFGELLALPTMAPYGSGLHFGEPLLGIVLPFTPLYLLTDSSMLAFNAAVVASFVLLGTATCLWVREITGSTAAGLFAGMLVLFSPWQIHYRSAANVLTLHYAVFGMWLLSLWLRRARLPLLLGSALLFQLQLVTAAQAAVPAIYLTLVWLATLWVGRGFAFEARRCVHLVVAALLFVGLSLPWLPFFQTAFDATSGQLPMREMARYSESFGEMLRLVGATGPAGVAAALGLALLPIGLRRGRLPRGAGLTLLGVCLGGALLFVVARGPSLDPEFGTSRLPGYYASQYLPLLGAFRAPVRLAGLTTLVLALLAGAGLASAEHRLASGRARRLLVVLPLLVAATWPALPPDMASPIEQRPQDLELAHALARLPEDAQILSLPMELGPAGAAVDERVRVHRRRQIGGFASVVPPAFRQAARVLGQWPEGGLELATALRTTHLVVPRPWLARHRAAALAVGYGVVAQTAEHGVLRLPDRELPPARSRLEAPARAAAGRWLTLALVSDAHRFEPRGHEDLSASWRRGDEVVRVAARLFHPGVVGPHAPSLLHVPTPAKPGHYELQLTGLEGKRAIPVDVRSQPTSFDLPILDAELALARGYTPPRFVRAAAALPLDVTLRAAAGPILLASSRHLLPERRGETQVLLQYRSATGERLALRLPPRASLHHDLAPGDVTALRWHALTPTQPGRYDLYVRLVATGLAERPMPWRPLLRGLQVERD